MVKQLWLSKRSCQFALIFGTNIRDGIYCKVVLTLSFIASNFNDLNGFLIIITSFYCIEKWEKYKLTGNKNDLFNSLIIISLVFLFLFIASPSPDLPVIIIVPIIIYLFGKSFHNSNKNGNHINLITLLILLVILIKVTVSPILILLLITLLKIKGFKHWKFPIYVSFIALSSFIIRKHYYYWISLYILFLLDTN